MNAKQRSPPYHKWGNNEEIDNGNGGENKKADDKESDDNHDGITMEYDFDLNLWLQMKNSWLCYPQSTIRNCLMKWMTNKNFMDFKTCKCSCLLNCKHCGLNEYSSAELVSLVFSTLFFHGNKHALQEKTKWGVLQMVKASFSEFNHGIKGESYARMYLIHGKIWHTLNYISTEESKAVNFIDLEDSN